MALIDCPDCGHKVSSTAPACPSCGRPIAGYAEARAAGANLQTVQETSKSLKMHSLFAWLAIFVGIALAWPAAEQTGNEEKVLIGFGIGAIGCLWLIVTRFRIWWHHK